MFIEAIRAILGNNHAVKGKNILKQANMINVRKQTIDNEVNNNPCLSGKDNG